MSKYSSTISLACTDPGCGTGRCTSGAQRRDSRFHLSHLPSPPLALAVGSAPRADPTRTCHTNSVVTGTGGDDEGEGPTPVRHGQVDPGGHSAVGAPNSPACSPLRQGCAGGRAQSSGVQRHVQRPHPPATGRRWHASKMLPATQSGRSVHRRSAKARHWGGRLRRVRPSPTVKTASAVSNVP